MAYVARLEDTLLLSAIMLMHSL